MMGEMIASYERIASQVNKDIFMCPTDYSYLYMNNEKINILIGNKRHWRTINQTLCTFLSTKYFLDKYWDNFHNTCLDRNNLYLEDINQFIQNTLKQEQLLRLTVLSEKKLEN
jgi:hypothetical protein